MLARFSASFQLMIVSFSYLDSFLIQILLIISVRFQHTQAALETAVLVHLHPQMVVKILVPAFAHLRLHLPDQPQHPAFGLRVNRQGRQPFQPCHRIVVAGTAVSVENLLFFHTQCHNDFLHFFAAEPYAPHDKLVSCPPVCLQAAPARNFSRRIGLFGALDFCPGVTSPEAIPLAAGHSIFKVLCLSARTSLPKKEALSRISKTSEKRLKSAYFHAYGIVL